VYRSCCTIIAAVVIVSSCADAHAGPCTAQIAALERAIPRETVGPDSGPTGQQSVGAQLHHQPTPGSVERAEDKAREAAAAALDRARTADAAGDGTACTRALQDAKELYGLE
jgi:hypothetical protein